MPDSRLFWKGVSAFRAGEQLHVISGRLVVFLELDILPQHDVGQFHRVEADQFEVGSLLFQVGQFQPQEVFVPAGVQSDLVVGDYVTAFLLFSEVAEIDAGTFPSPSSFAAASRPWPAITPFAPSRRIGFVNPNSLMLAAIWAICSSECVRGSFCTGLVNPAVGIRSGGSQKRLRFDPHQPLAIFSSRTLASCSSHSGSTLTALEILMRP